MQVKFNVIAGAVVAMCAVAASAQEVVEVKIGHVAPISGPQATYGRDNENGALMAVEDINAKGTRKTFCDRRNYICHKPLWISVQFIKRKPTTFEFTFLNGIDQ